MSMCLGRVMLVDGLPNRSPYHTLIDRELLIDPPWGILYTMIF